MSREVIHLCSCEPEYYDEPTFKSRWECAEECVPIKMADPDDEWKIYPTPCGIITDYKVTSKLEDSIRIYQPNISSQEIYKKVCETCLLVLRTQESNQ